MEVRTATHILLCALVFLAWESEAHAGVATDVAALDAATAPRDGEPRMPTGLPPADEGDPVEESGTELEPELDDFLLPSLELEAESLLGTDTSYGCGQGSHALRGIPDSLERPPRR